MRGLAWIAVLTALIGGLYGCGLVPYLSQGYDNALFDEVFDELYNNHYSQPSEAQLWKGAIQGMIDSLDDPFTNYFDAEAYQAFREGQEESYVGIGITVENVSEQVVVRNVFPGSPAEEAGLMAGDRITHVDGVDYRSKSFIETTSVIRGEPDTEVQIGYERAGIESTIFVTMERRLIDNPSVSGEVLDNHIGVIRIHGFGAETVDIFNEYLDAFEAENIESLILDLRDNGGGDLYTLIDLLNVFLSKEAKDIPLFTLETYDDRELVIYHEEGKTTERKPYPIVLLVNGRSASASEVFAAAMYEYGGYPVFGTTTFGKGTLQSSIPLKSNLGDYLHLTIGRWLTSEGNWVHFTGDTPGFEPSTIVEQNPYFNTPLLYLEADETYVYDQVHEKIKIAQQMMNAIGYTVREDGYFNSDMADQLAVFQSEKGLNVTGELDSETAHELSSNLFNFRQDISNDEQLTYAYAYLKDLLDD